MKTDGTNLRRQYVNQRLAGSFNGLSGFLRARQLHNKEAVEKELRQLNSFALHRNARKNFPRRRIKIHFINHTWVSDLKDISSISRHNNGNNFVLIVVDGFSKKGYTRLIKRKSSEYMIKAFKSIAKEAGVWPKYLFTDQGTEYRSKAFQQMLKEHGTQLYHVYSHIKSSIAERYIRTLFTNLERYKTHKKRLK